MNSLTELYNSALVPLDAELEKQAAAELEQYAVEEAEMIKEAEEQDAAGRIMARGFADELEKLAAGVPPFVAAMKAKKEGEEDEDEDEEKKKEKKGPDVEKQAQYTMRGAGPTPHQGGLKAMGQGYNQTIKSKGSGMGRLTAAQTGANYKPKPATRVATTPPKQQTSPLVAKIPPPPKPAG